MQQKLKDYLHHPGSFIAFLLIMLAAIITVGVMIFIVAYILIKWNTEYNTGIVCMGI